MIHPRLLAFVPLVIACAALAGETKTYEYDAQGRLIKTTKAGGPVAGQEKCTNYDPAGNRILRSVSATGCTPGGSSGGGPGGGGPSPSFTINNPSAVEEGFTIVFAVTKTGAGAANISYATANGTATTADYVPKSGSLSFRSGDTTKSILVATRTDTAFEGNETFVVNLSNATGGASIADAQGAGTIINKEANSCSPLCM